MKSKNTFSKAEFLFHHAVWIAISLFIYVRVLFRCVGTLTFQESKWILYGILFVSVLAGLCLQMKYRRNNFSVFLNLIIGYGCYAAITYIEINKTAIVIALAISGILAVLYAVLILTQKIKNKTQKPKILWNRMKNILRAGQTFFAFGFVFVLVLIGGNSLFSSTIIDATVPATNMFASNEQTINNNIETILKLQEEEWAELKVQEKLDVLQTVANIEQRYLGLPNELNVGAANLEENVLSYYSDKTHEIVINLDSLTKDPAWRLLQSVCHEAFHSYQHRIVDVYNQTEQDMKDLRLLRDASSYAEEFDHYISGEDDIAGYYSQKCEKDAREYAEQAVSDYYQRIEEYLQESQSETQ